MGQQSRATAHRWAPVKVSKVVPTVEDDIVRLDIELDGNIRPEWARAFAHMSAGRNLNLTLHDTEKSPRITLTTRSDHREASELAVLYVVEEVNLYIRLAIELVGQ
ncbi:hypothetical protein [Prescottella subtropica]|uniref:hypothetical protein n=1 Tax=Prescottella subtropica TaxID=2545757 RepID=UPI0010F7198F|nr:hypothetical protein [Prescottella subtropica]